MEIHPVAADIFQVWSKAVAQHCHPESLAPAWLTRDRKSAQYAEKEKFICASNWAEPKKVRVESVIEREN